MRFAENKIKLKCDIYELNVGTQKTIMIEFTNFSIYSNAPTATLTLRP